MKRGLHVISAVLAVMTLEEADRLKRLKENTGLRYMMAETSYYRQPAIYTHATCFARVHSVSCAQWFGSKGILYMQNMDVHGNAWKPNETKGSDETRARS